MAEKVLSQAVDVVMGLHNSALTVERAVRSVINQKGVNARVLCVDDCSPDNSADLARNAGAVVVARHEKNAGPSAAWNTALEHATAPYVMHLDSDDWLEQGALEALVSAMDGNNKSFAYGFTKYWGMRSDLHMPPPSQADEFYKSFPSLYAILRRRDYGLKYLGTEEWQEGISIPMDWSMALQLIERGYHGVCVPRLVLHYTLHHHGLASQQKRNPEPVLAAMRKHHPKLEAVSL